MRVLFIYPNQMYTGDKIVFNYGVACLSALLKDNGHDCQLIQCHNCDTDTNHSSLPCHLFLVIWCLHEILFLISKNFTAVHQSYLEVSMLLLALMTLLK